MKIIIIILICLFFSLTITPINEFLTNPTPAQPSTTGPASETQTAESASAKPRPQPQPESGLQTQVNMLSTQITTTNAIAVEAKNKVDEISSEITKLKEALKKAPDI